MLDCNDVKVGMKVVTGNLSSTDGMLVKETQLLARKEGLFGEVLGFVAGHGGDVWWVKHSDDSVGAYSYLEIDEENA